MKKENREFKDYLLGLMVLTVISTILNFIFVKINFLESYGIVMFFATIYGGVQTFKDTKDANISE